MAGSIDITEMLREELRKEKREEDGLLHCSSDLVGSLRHTQLRIAGAGSIESQLLADVRMHTGTMWHDYFAHMFIRLGVPVMQEVRVTPWLPEGWGGTADWLFFNPNTRKYILRDLKTTKGEAIPFIAKNPSETHVWQLSAYYHALRPLIELEDEVQIYYLPMNDVRKKFWQDPLKIEPIIKSFLPVALDDVFAVMRNRKRRVDEYVAAIKAGAGWINDCLADPMPREQKLYWNKSMNVFDLKLGPHWSTEFCPYPLELCDCSEQKTNKIGHYVQTGQYIPREGYSNIEPLIEPTEEDYDERYQ